MGQAKLKQRAAFAPQLIEEWESEDCVNFAVALARLTGWILHVDWWSTSTTRQEDVSVDQLKPLRVYVGDNRDKVFDVRGIRSLVEFSEGVIVKVARRIATSPGSVYTRYYDETKLASLPLRRQPDEQKIARATEAILGNHLFLAGIPRRSGQGLPAHHAARYSYGLCAPFAEAMSELTGLQPAALLALRFAQHFEGTRRGENGYIHSVVLHPDGMAEDAWGKASLDEIASRFGAVEFAVSCEEHQAVVKKLISTSGERFGQAVREAKDLISLHRQTLAWEGAAPVPAAPA